MIGNTDGYVSTVLNGALPTIVLEIGASSRLCAMLKAGEKVVLMGPTGTATHIAQNETVLLAGGGLGNAVLFSIGQALRVAGCKIAGKRTEQIELLALRSLAAPHRDFPPQAINGAFGRHRA